MSRWERNLAGKEILLTKRLQVPEGLDLEERFHPLDEEEEEEEEEEEDGDEDEELESERKKKKKRRDKKLEDEG
jgi:hypothetical protein